jgi:hypothetical protein
MRRISIWHHTEVDTVFVEPYQFLCGKIPALTRANRLKSSTQLDALRRWQSVVLGALGGVFQVGADHQAILPI